MCCADSSLFVMKCSVLSTQLLSSVISELYHKNRCSSRGEQGKTVSRLFCTHWQTRPGSVSLVTGHMTKYNVYTCGA